MIKDVLQKSYEQQLRQLVASWRRFINELGNNNPQDVLPGTRAALADTYVCLDDLESVGC